MHRSAESRTWNQVSAQFVLASVVVIGVEMGKVTLENIPGSLRGLRTYTNFSDRKHRSSRFYHSSVSLTVLSVLLQT